MNGRNDFQQFQQLMQLLFGGFPREEPNPDRLDAYLVAIGDLPYELVKKAVFQAIRTCKWMPAASELRGIAKTMMPKKTDPYIEQILREGRNRVKRPVAPHLKVINGNAAPKLGMSQQEMNRRRTQVLNQLEGLK